MLPYVRSLSFAFVFGDFLARISRLGYLQPVRRLQAESPPLLTSLTMQQVERERLMAEIAALLATDSVPMTDSTLENEVYRYRDPDYTKRELDDVFAASPRVLAFSAQIPEKGDFFADDISGEPLVIMRSEDGVARAFFNVCLHRGTKVVCDEAGNRQRHTCPFHGWVYDSRGDLRAVSSSDAFGDLGPTRQGLAPVSVVERHGFIWRLPDGWTEADLIDSLGGLGAELEAFGLDGYRLERTEVFEEAMNWKFVVDGFLETYHFKFLHGKTIGPYIRSNFGPFQEYGANVRMVVLRTSYEEAVLDADGPVDPMPHIAVAYQLFPNTVVVWQGTHFETWTSYPTDGAPDKCTIRVSVLIPEPTTPEDGNRDWDRNWAILTGTVLEEDFEVSRRAQAGYATGAITKVIYGRNEPALQAFHRNIAERIPSN